MFKSYQSANIFNIIYIKRKSIPCFNHISVSNVFIVRVISWNPRGKYVMFTQEIVLIHRFLIPGNSSTDLVNIIFIWLLFLRNFFQLRLWYWFYVLILFGGFLCFLIYNFYGHNHKKYSFLRPREQFFIHIEYWTDKTYIDVLTFHTILDKG